jgi:3-phenylpropionate/trans-cinnamate dioxygenase ferredoxin reductase component
MEQSPPVPYVLVGGGMTAAAAATAIRAADPAGGVTLISSDTHPPYARPPLSKALWKGEPEEKIWLLQDDVGVDVRLGRSVRGIDPRGRSVTDDQGETTSYEMLLLATGGTPRQLPFETGGSEVIYFRSYDDYRRLRDLAARGARIAVLGGGFIGSEIAAAVRSVGCEVVMLFPEAAIGGRVYPADLAGFLVDYYREQGVDVRPGETATGLERRGKQTAVRTKGGETLVVDAVVAGLGIQPNVTLAEQAGAKIDNGIIVDEQLRTSVSGIFAAGDVANFFNPALNTRMRVEHEDNANAMGAAVGRSMAGQGAPYTHLPFFYSDLFALGYEAVGELDARLQTVSVWKEPFREGVIHYLKDGRVRGVLNWNTWGQVDAARARIGKPLERDA